MKVISRTAQSDIASVYIAEDERGRLLEFVESTQPPLSIREKWVIIVSTLYGCPVNCTFCDAGGSYSGKIDTAGIIFQVEELIRRRFPSGEPETDRFKIQFSRMGEPSFNPSVIEALRLLAGRYKVSEFIPSMSTIAPHGTDLFFKELMELKDQYYQRSFQLQFSIHSTDTEQRDQWMPVKKWDFSRIARYGEEFYHPEGKRITLNFAVSTESRIDPAVVRKYFSPECFLVKLTPVNPTLKARTNNILTAIREEEQEHSLATVFRDAGYEVIVSIGEWEENKIGSNCGQYISTYLRSCGNEPPGESYSYGVNDIR